MKIYRILHKPTGLFYNPGNQQYHGRFSNLMSTGKIYRNKPTKPLIYKKLVISKSQRKEGLLEVFLCHKESDWEIIKYELVESENYKNMKNYIDLNYEEYISFLENEGKYE